MLESPRSRLGQRVRGARTGPIGVAGMRGGGGFGRFRRFAYSCACWQRCRLGSPACARAWRFEAAACRRGRPRGRPNVVSIAGRDSRRDSVVSYVRTILWKVGVARVFDDLHINEKSGVPVWVQIRNHLLFLIKSERIKPGDVLPTVRELAARLGVNYNTVHKVYQDLEADGLICSSRGKRSFVADVDSKKLELPRVSGRSGHRGIGSGGARGQHHAAGRASACGSTLRADGMTSCGWAEATIGCRAAQRPCKGGIGQGNFWLTAGWRGHGQGQGQIRR